MTKSTLGISPVMSLLSTQSSSRLQYFSPSALYMVCTMSLCLDLVFLSCTAPHSARRRQSSIFSAEVWHMFQDKVASLKQLHYLETTRITMTVFTYLKWPWSWHRRENISPCFLDVLLLSLTEVMEHDMWYVSFSSRDNLCMSRTCHLLLWTSMSLMFSSFSFWS